MSTLISITEAMALLRRGWGMKVSRPTVRLWCRKYGIGHQLSDERSRWYVEKEKLEEFMNADKKKKR